MFRLYLFNNGWIYGLQTTNSFFRYVPLPRPDLSRIGRQSAGNQRKDRIQPSIDLLYNSNYSVFYFNFSSPEFQRNVGKDK